ncbi:hypothetical protein CRG98_029075 [Punica granatum]|uniref:Reverse transcriptase domain-containing protein n=1 Tax=Punica granatum TaxID=22663 RepID=A0A2I0J2Q7_PUNGR|nr:hypothetical protein CRG98_029075 [Punica granatum]
MAEEDKVKTTFITMWDTFCYKVMPFGLKNARATYQRAMVTLFHDMMHKEIEVYVDDMIAKSKEGEDHLVNLKWLFERLKKYKLRLNLAKCTFGVKSGKLLGFVVSEKGIEVDPDKVKAIMELPPPSTVRENNANHSSACFAKMQQLSGMIVRTRMWTLVGDRIARFWIVWLGRLSAIPWGRMTDTCEIRSSHLSFYDS